MTKDKIKEAQDLKIRRAISAHEDWKRMWVKDDRFFSVEWISPRGKSMTYHEYCVEVSKHMARTVEKIRKALEVTN